MHASVTTIPRPSPRSLRGHLAGALVGLGLALLAAPPPAAATPYEVPLPPSVLPPEVPADNPLTGEKVALGRKLFFDRRLSADGTVSCATCHDPRAAFADRRGGRTSAGVRGQLGTRNAPTALDAAFLSTQFWDGRAATLEEQALQPFVNPVEMALADHEALARLVAGLAEYPPLFAEAFGHETVTARRIVQAIASFERTLVSVSAPIDRFLAGDREAISEAARRGWTLYNGKARCNTCHGYVGAFPFFTDEEFHNIGVAANDVHFAELARKVQNSSASQAQLAFEKGVTELGRYNVTHEQRHIGAFKTPPLRNVALTAPYMHDGSEATLADVIEFYDRGGNPNPFLDGGIRPLHLTDGEKRDLVALLETFTSDDLDRFAELAALMPKNGK